MKTNCVARAERRAQAARDDAAHKRALSDLLRSSKRVFLLARRRELDKIRALAPQVFLLGRNNDYCLLSNRAAPNDFTFDHVAPRKR
jgi:hypothetical protein